MPSQQNFSPDKNNSSIFLYVYINMTLNHFPLKFTEICLENTFNNRRTLTENR